MSDKRWSQLEQLLSRPSPFPNESGKLPNGYYEPSSQVSLSLSVVASFSLPLDGYKSS
jgi:hypothetical protein